MSFKMFKKQMTGTIIPNGAVKELGVQTAYVLGELIDKYNMFRKYRKLNNKGHFFYTIDAFEKSTGIKRSVQERAIKILAEKELISTAKYGLPVRRFFWFTKDNFKNILALESNRLKGNDKDC